MLQALLEILFPPACVACGRVMESAGPFCDECQLQLSPLPAPHCSRCAEPGSHPDGLCARCTAHPPPFLTVHAPFVHEGAIARAIHRFKYEDHPELGGPLGALLARECRAFLETRPNAQLLAIPLHVSRYHDRKFDQAQLLTGSLAKTARKRRATGSLERIRPTERQVGRSESEREENVRGAFRAGSGFEGKELLLIDDVFTTGATARAAAEALLQAGAANVSVLCLARAYSG